MNNNYGNIVVDSFQNISAEWWWRGNKTSR